MALFLAISEMPLKLCSFLPLLNSMAVLKVFDPLSLVGSEIPMVIDPLAMSHVGVPFTNVYVTIAVREASSASGFVVIPLTLVGSAVGPPLSAKTVSHVPSPLAIVCRARLEGVDGPRTITETCWQGFQLDYLAIEKLAKLSSSNVSVAASFETGGSLARGSSFLMGSGGAGS
eukprot:CAMPEP_0169246346 /NCGR_PEP_ID=MMETSP1016-20121227/34684_1 /TAXON_ID=342587 /ORGANISM="Karlodinium micrum, Strain CCMP2283" /LENGTH=172 /DNA_ID=CAMNT_0009326917 /DNA_START=536 /DNA_END=1055 /DNA_ORIENTATION=+